MICVGYLGDFYRGEISGIVIVVKKVDFCRVKWDFFLIELEVCEKVFYNNFVVFFGMCFDCEEEKLLVYKYYFNNDLVILLLGYY